MESLMPDLQIIIPRLKPNPESAVLTPEQHVNPTHTQFPSTNVLSYTVRPQLTVHRRVYFQKELKILVF